MGISKAKLLERREQNEKRSGPKRQYDPLLMAQELLEWSKDESSINFTGFCAERGYLPGLIWKLDKESPEFSEAYQIAKMRLAERRERLLNSELLNYGAFQRYQKEYDPFLAKHEEDDKDRDAARRKQVAQQEQINLVTLAKLAADGKISQRD